jgi:DNA-binding LacI/PurR family transcriptional regulator
MATIYEIAHKAHVSVTTVSRVINDSTKVNKDTREKVQKVIQELNYSPNIFGKQLGKKNTNLILILLHGIDNPFFSNIIKGIEITAYQNNYNVLISETNGQVERENQYLELLKNHFVDGVILLSYEQSLENLNKLTNNYPIVEVVEYNEASNTPYISIDYLKASKDIMNYFISNDHKKIAFVAAGENQRISINKKYQGYSETLKENNLEIITNKIDFNEFSLESAMNTTENIVNKHPDVTAFFCCSDLIARGTIAKLKQLNIKVPDDIEVFGFDDLIYSELSSPTISTVSLNTYNLGVKAMEILYKRIMKIDYIEDYYFGPYELKFKESTIK